MKNDKIYKLFRNVSSIFLYNQIADDDGEECIVKQYICDGAACYSLENLPLFDEQTIKGLIGGKSDEAGVFVETAPEWLTNALPYNVKGDIPVDIEQYDAFGLTVFTTSSSDYPEVVCFVDPDYVKPFIKNDGEITYRYRSLTDTINAIIVQDGMFTAAVIMQIIPRGNELAHCISFADKVYRKLKQLEAEEHGHENS